MSISIVHKTTWLNPTAAALPVTLTIPAVTAGNTVIVLVGTNIQNAPAVPTATLGAEALTKATTTGSGITGAYYLLSAAGGETTVTFSAGSESPAFAVVYEITPCTYVTSNAVLDSITTGTNVNPGASGLTGSGNCAYFAVSASGASFYSPPTAYGTVNGPYTADYTYAGPIYTGIAAGTGIFASQLNVTGTQTPTFNMSANPTSYAYGTAGIVMLENSPSGGNARVDQQVREAVVVDSTVNVRVDQQIRESLISLCNLPPVTGNFNYIKTFEQDDGQVTTFALDSTGILWQENITSQPNILSSYNKLILPGSYCRSVTSEDEEWMVYSNLVNGTDIPRHGSNNDRISQVGPGAGPAVVGQTGGTTQFNIVASPNGLTQQAAFSDPGDSGHLSAVNWSAGPTSTTAGNVLTIFYMNAQVFILPYQFLLVGGSVYISISSPSSLTSLTGTYIVTGVGQAVPPGGSAPRWYFTVQTTQTGNVFVGGPDTTVGTFQIGLATLTTTGPATIQVGNQVTLAGVANASWDDTYTILTTVNGGQYQITATSLTSNVATYNYTPIGSSPNITANEQVSVTGCSNGPIVNGTSIFNVTNATVASASPSQFTVNISGANVTSAAETGNGIINGTIFQFDPGLTLAGTSTTPIFGNSGGGTVSIAGQIAAGTRQAVVIFQTRNGYLTAPSPPATFETTGSTTTLQVSNIPLGPPNVIARIIAFTGANGGNFFYIPEPVTIQGTGQPVTYTSTVINDNQSHQATFTFTDAVLLAATAIDIEGNDLFNQIELGSSAWDVAYAGRMFYGLENNKIQNLVNPTFDGGYLIAVEGVFPNQITVAVPMGWTVDPTNGVGGGVVLSPIFGNSYQITNSSGSAQTTYGMIYQSAFQDFYQVPIFEANTLYSIRVRASAPSAPIASGNLVFDLYSPGLARQYGAFTIPLNTLATSLQLFSGTLLTSAFNTQVPSDLQYRIYVTNIPDGESVLIDRTEPYPTNEPVLGTELQGSYAFNLEAFDGVTGPLGVGEQNNQPAVGAFVNYDILYILKTGSLLSTQDSPGNEPSEWTIREVDNKVGLCGINAYDWGEEWAVWANVAGLWAFNGGKPIKISQEIQPTWNAINWLCGDTIWVRNDIVNRRIMVGVPMATPNQWLPYAPINANPTSPNVILMLNYKELNTFNDLVERAGVKISFTGKLIAWDMSRKWSIWQIPSPYADFVLRPDGTQPLFYCCGDGTSRISQQISGLYQDNGVPIDDLYTTYGFVKDERAQFGPLLSAHRNLYKYLDMNLYGSGNVLITALPNVLTPTYPYTLPAISMANPAQNNVERPLNQTANRLFMQFRCNTMNAGFNLSSLTISMVKDPHAPVRGLG